MRSNQLEIASPCHENWDAMREEGTRRFCDVCQKHVHDLSAMAQDEANALLREKAGESLCVRYASESDGTLRFRDLVPRASLTRKLVRTAFAAAALAACAPHGDAPVEDLGDAIIESLREQTVATPDGGCDYTTGPFTTFHFPAGHALCKQTGDRGFEAVEMGELPSIEPPAIAPPSEPRVDMGDVQTPPPPPAVDPIRPLTMGQAIAMPEPKDPFVPCEPVADKKPPKEPRTMPVKGGIRAPRKPVVEDKPQNSAKMGLMLESD